MPTGFPTGMNLGGERKKGVKVKSVAFAVANQRMHWQLYLTGMILVGNLRQIM